MRPALCCANAGCRRKKPIRVMRSGLTGRVYVVTNYEVRDNGMIESKAKHDVPPDDTAALVASLLRDPGLEEQIRLAISDPGSVVPREMGSSLVADESISHWSARAVMHVLPRAATESLRS